MPSTPYALVLRPPRKDGLRLVHLRLASHRQPTYRAIPDLALSEKLPAADMRDMLSHRSISQTEEYFAELERSELN